MRWLRLYTDAINDPKLAKLSDSLHRFWIGILCIARKHEQGFLPSAEEIAFHLRISPRKAKSNLQALADARLLDQTPDGLRPHNWDIWQPPSDSSTERSKRFRQRQRNGGCNVAGTAPESEVESEQTRREGESETGNAHSHGSRRSWPVNFSLSSEHIHYAETKGFNPSEAQTIFLKFANHHQANDSQFADWNAALRSWIDREQRYSPRSGQQMMDGRL